MRRARAGDAAALDLLVRRSQARLLRLARARMGARLRAVEDSTDVVQSALREAVRSLRRFQYRGSQSFHRWLLAIVENKIRHHARDQRRERRDPGPVVRIDALGGGGGEPVAAGSPAEAAVASEVRQRVREAMERLDESERDMILWRQFQQLSNREVAHLLGTTVEAAGKRYLRALQRLRGLLEANDVGPLI